MGNRSFIRLLGHVYRATLLLVGALLVTALPAFGQGTVQGQEQVISYSGTNAQLVPPNTPLTSMAAGSGTNTFILPIANPTVAVRVYITNNTANGCNSPVTIQMFSSTDSQVASFNSSLANWQTVLLQSPLNSSLVSTVSTSIPASSAIFVTSTAIVSPKVAIQIVSTAGVCATTNVEVVAVVTQVAVGSPLISSLTNTPTGGANQVQGVGSNLSSASIVNPVVISGAELPVNGQFLNAGLDNFATPSSTTSDGGGAATSFLNSVPTLTQNVPGEWALGISNGAGDIGTSTYNANWTCAPNGNNCASSGQMVMSAAAVNSGLQWVRKFGNASTNVLGTAVILTFKAGSIGSASGVVGSPVAKTVTAGDPLIVIAFCSGGGPVCAVTNVADSLSNTFAPVVSTGAFTNGVVNNQGIFVWASTNVTNGGADSITITATGTSLAFQVIELTGASPSTPNQPQIYLEADPIGALVTHPDAQSPNQWTCNVTLTTNTTSICRAAPTTVNNVNVRNYVTDFQINTTTAGTGTTITLVDGTGTNCGTGTLNLSAIAYPNTTVGLQNMLNFRTPFVAPLATAVCVQQAGTTPGTSVVEIHGFLAP